MPYLSRLPGTGYCFSGSGSFSSLQVLKFAGLPGALPFRNGLTAEWWVIEVALPAFLATSFSLAAESNIRQALFRAVVFAACSSLAVLTGARVMKTTNGLSVTDFLQRSADSSS